MQFVDVIGSLRRHWRVSIALLLLSAIGLGVFLFTRKQARGADRWLASAQLLVPVRDADGNLPEGVPPILLQGQAAVALTKEIKTEALRRAGLDAKTAGDVLFGFRQAARNDGGRRGDIISLSVIARDYDEAIKLIGTYADTYIAVRRQAVANGYTASQRDARNSLVVLDKRLDEVDAQLRSVDPSLLALVNSSAVSSAEGAPPAIDLPSNAPIDTVLLAYQRRTLMGQINDARQAYADASVRSLVPQGYASVVERPVPKQIIPELPSPLIPVIVALGIGLLLAVAVPVLIDYLDHTIRDPRVAGNALSATVLSTIPASSQGTLAALAQPGSPRDSAYRALAATSVATDQLPRAIVVTSPVGEMQDSVAANFAAALAGLGLRVALVATDPRQDWFVDSGDMQDAPTLPSLLALARAGRLNGQIHDSLVPTDLHNLFVLPPGALPSGPGAEALLEGLPTLLLALAGADIDVTVIAAPALLENPSATILAWSTRSVLWVIEAGQVTEREAHEAASRLELAGAEAFGVTMVDAKN